MRHLCYVVQVEDCPFYYGAGTAVVGQQVTVMCEESQSLAMGADVPGCAVQRDPVPEAARVACVHLDGVCAGEHVLA